MKIVIAFLAILIAIIASISLTTATLSDSDMAAIKLSVFSALDDTGRFSYVSANVDQDDNLNIWYIPKNTDQTSIMTDMARILGAYSGICKTSPELSNLNIYMGTKGNVAGELYCMRSWLSMVKTNPDGSTDGNSAGLLVLKVLGTFTKY
jgi:hypothetical protein